MRVGGPGESLRGWLALPPLGREERARLRLRAGHVAARRSGLVLALLLLAYAVLGARAASIMLSPDERVQRRARAQFQQARTVEAQRGEIRARDGSLLAATVFLPSLHADPSLMDDELARELARGLAPLIGQDEEQVYRRLQRRARRDVKLARAVQPERLDEILALVPPSRRRDPRGKLLWVVPEPRRYYPEGSFASNLLGLVGFDGSGLFGVERAYDRYLRGDTFKFVSVKDARGRGIRLTPLAFQTSHRGGTVYLTLDPVIQLAAEEALDEVMERSEPEAADIVVMDPHTGELLAVANRPAGNPNDRLHVRPADFKNHAVMDQVEPGSVFKPFVVALALEEGIVRPDSLVDCEGGAYRVGRKTITDTHSHGLLTIGEIIKYSSNVGAAKLALRLGPERLIGGLKRFGFGSRVGIGLEGEVAGRIRSPDRIRTIELATTAYGQGVTASALQLVSAVSVIANGGVRVQPYLLKEVRDRHGVQELASEPRELGRVISGKVAREVAEMMVGVTEDGGTAPCARVPGYRVAGKTGTAWKVVDGHYSPTARVAGFVGFAPAEDPRIAIAVLVDTPHKGSRYGGRAAAPAFAQVAEAALRHLGVPPDPELLEQYQRPAYCPSRAGLGVEPAPLLARSGLEEEPAVAEAELEEPPLAPAPLPAARWVDGEHLALPDLSGLSMRDALVALQGLGLELVLHGHGTLVAQKPSAGTPVSPGESVELRFR